MQDPDRASKAFMDMLLARMTTPSCSVAARTASAAYLASFLARAGFLPLRQLSRALQVCSSSWPGQALDVPVCALWRSVWPLLLAVGQLRR